MTKITDLSDQDLHYMERLLGREFAKELDQGKNWNTNYTHKPIGKANQIRTCINAVRSLRQSNRLKSEKW
mgnify:FL=1|jgi:hypothetical protein